MCQVYLALLYIVYIYLTLLSVYIFRIKLLMLCLYTYAYCIYRCCIFYGFVYLPFYRDQHFVTRLKALPWYSEFYFSLYEVFVNIVFNCRIHLVSTGLLMCNERDCLFSIVCRIIICYPSSHVIKIY